MSESGKNRLRLRGSEEENAGALGELEERYEKKRKREDESSPGFRDSEDTGRGKTPIWRGKPVLAAFWLFYFTGALSVILAIIVESTPPRLPLFAWGIIIPFAALMVLLPILFQRAWDFTLTNREARSKFRLWVGRVKEAPLKMVTDVTVDQGVIARLLGFGVVRIDTAGTPFPGVKFWGIRKPFEVAKKIRETQDSVRTRVKMEKKREGPRDEQV